MNRRNFVSMLLGSAGAGVVLWRLPERRIVLPPRELPPTRQHHPLCNCAQCARPFSFDDIEATIKALWRTSGPAPELMIVSTATAREIERYGFPMRDDVRSLIHQEAFP